MLEKLGRQLKAFKKGASCFLVAYVLPIPLFVFSFFNNIHFLPSKLSIGFLCCFLFSIEYGLQPLLRFVACKVVLFFDTVALIRNLCISGVALTALFCGEIVHCFFRFFFHLIVVAKNSFLLCLQIVFSGLQHFERIPACIILLLVNILKIPMLCVQLIVGTLRFLLFRISWPFCQVYYHFFKAAFLGLQNVLYQSGTFFANCRFVPISFSQAFVLLTRLCFSLVKGCVFRFFSFLFGYVLLGFAQKLQAFFIGFVQFFSNMLAAIFQGKWLIGLMLHKFVLALWGVVSFFDQLARAVASLPISFCVAVEYFFSALKYMVSFVVSFLNKVFYRQCLLLGSFVSLLVRFAVRWFALPVKRYIGFAIYCVNSFFIMLKSACLHLFCSLFDLGALVWQACCGFVCTLRKSLKILLLRLQDGVIASFVFIISPALWLISFSLSRLVLKLKLFYQIRFFFKAAILRCFSTATIFCFALVYFMRMLISAVVLLCEIIVIFVKNLPRFFLDTMRIYLFLPLRRGRELLSCFVVKTSLFITKFIRHSVDLISLKVALLRNVLFSFVAWPFNFVRRCFLLFSFSPQPVKVKATKVMKKKAGPSLLVRLCGVVWRFGLSVFSSCFSRKKIKVFMWANHPKHWLQSFIVAYNNKKTHFFCLKMVGGLFLVLTAYQYFFVYPEPRPQLIGQKVLHAPLSSQVQASLDLKSVSFDLQNQDCLRVFAAVGFSFESGAESIDVIEGFSFKGGEILKKELVEVVVEGGFVKTVFDVVMRFDSMLDCSRFPFQNHRLSFVLENKNVFPQEMRFISCATDLRVSKQALFRGAHALVSSDVTTGVMSDSFFNLSGGFPVAVFDLLTASRASQFSWLLLLPFVFILLLLLFLPISSLPMLVRLVLSLGFVVLLAIYRVSVVSFQVMPFVVTIFDLLYALALFLSSLSALVFLYYFFAKKSLDKNTSGYLFFLQLCLILFCLITALS